MAARREVELYDPVKAFLEHQGYAVKGEVNGCDLVAVCDDLTVIVELKAAFNLALVFQGIDRQRITAAVYLAVEAPRRREARWRDVEHLCRRLGLGLITVRFGRSEPVVEVVREPLEMPPRRNTRRANGVLQEFKGRSGDFNIGGSTRRPLVTVYREEALRVAECLRQANGPAKVKAVREATGVARAATILQENHYGWFERVRLGVYRLTPAGLAGLATYATVIGQT